MGLRSWLRSTEDVGAGRGPDSPIFDGQFPKLEPHPEVTDYEVQVSGRTVRYRAAGVGEPIVLVHGLAGSTRWWARNLGALTGRYRVYLVDLPGFGAMRRVENRFVLAEATSWLLAWMDAVGLGQAHLVGHSMGGYISLRLAAQRPDALHCLVLVAPAGVWERRSIRGQVFPLLKAARYTTWSFLPVLFADALRAGPSTLVRAARDLLAEDVRKSLQEIRVPTLMIWGEYDLLVPPTIGLAMRQDVANARLLILERAGHVPMFDRPREFNDALLRFLDGEPVGE